MKQKIHYIETPWRVDGNNVLHMNFPVELFMNISDEDWVKYKNNIINEFHKIMERNK